MSAAIQTVEAFLNACAIGKEGMKKAFLDYFTPESIWENVGIATTRGPDEAIAFMGAFEEQRGVVAFRAENLAIAAQGHKVLTERIDYLLRADGSEDLALRLMGIFEVEDGKITAWRDYFDSAAVTGGSSG